MKCIITLSPIAGGNPGITDSKLRRSSSLPQLPTRPNLPSVPHPYTSQYASGQSPTSAFQKPTSSMQHVDGTQVDSTISYSMEDSIDSLKSIQSFDGGQSLDIGVCNVFKGVLLTLSMILHAHHVLLASG